MAEDSMIPFFSLAGRRQETDHLIQSALARVWESDVFVGGDCVEKFEERFSDFVGTTQCIGVGNGMDALRLIIQGLGIGPGDEVIVPAQTFIATWLAVIHAGATPIPVDVDPGSGNINAALVEPAITSRTAAIIVVHLHGRIGPIDELRRVCSMRNLYLIEDAAQSHGAELRASRSGSLADAAAFSFYPTKNLGALGDAGCVTTSNHELAEKIRSLRSYGATPASKYVHQVAGWNSRLDPVQAACLNVFLDFLPEWNQRRKTLADAYLSVLNQYPNTSRDVLPMSSSADSATNVWHHFVVQVKNRQEFVHRMGIEGVGTEIHYPIPAYRSAAVVPTRSGTDLTHSRMEVADELARSVVSLPMHPWLGSAASLVLKALDSYLRELSAKVDAS